MKNLAIIPIRMGSKRLPRKNIRDFFGKPIFVHTLEHARQSGLFNEIIVSTEAEEVREICREYGLELPFIRPEVLAGNKAQLVHVLKHVLDEYQHRDEMFDNFCMLWATAPMRTADDIRAAYDLLKDDTDAVVGTTHFDRSVFSGMRRGSGGYIAPLFPDKLRLPSVEQPEVFVDNGSMCWVRTTAFREHGTWLPPKLKAYLMPRHCSVDIDTQEDWDLAKYYYRKYVFQSK